MLIKTEIFNRNYYPIRLYKLNHRVLSSDKINESDLFHINATSFNNDIGMIIKPFQSKEFMTSIVLNDDVNEFSGHIYYDETIASDSQQYGKFGILSAWDVDVKYNFVTLRITDDAPIIFNKDNIDNLQSNYELNIKFDMQSIKDWDTIFKHLNTIGFDSYEIEKYDFVTEGIHSVNINTSSPPPDQCKKGLLYRGPVIEGLTNDNLISKATTYLSKYRIYKKDNNVWFDMLCNKNFITNIYNLASTASSPSSPSATGTLSTGLSQQTIGMDVVLVLKSNTTKTKYKLNLKILRPILFVAAMPSSPQTNIHEEVKSLINFFIEPLNFDYNSLIPVPNIMKILCNENDFYTGYLKVIPFSFKNLINEDSYNDIKFTINNVTQKTNDDNVSSGKLLISGDSLPTTRIVPRETYNFENNKFDIFVDVTGISENYSNTLQIDYVYGDSTGILEVPVKILPTLTQQSNIEFISTSLENSTYIVPNDKGAIYEDVNQTYQLSSLGEDVLTVRMINSGLAVAKITKVELESPYVYEKQLTIKYNNYVNSYGAEHQLTLDVQTNLDNIKTYIARYESDFNTLFNSYKTSWPLKETFNNMSLSDKDKNLSNFLSYKVESIVNGYNYNAGAIKQIVARIKLNKIQASKNGINGKLYTVKVTYKDVDSGKTYETYMTSDRYALSMVSGTESLTYDNSSEDIKYVRPNTRNTLYFNLTKQINISDFQKSYSIVNKYMNNIVITSGTVINTNEEIGISDNEWFIDKTQFPMTVASLNSTHGDYLSFDINMLEERAYNFSLRLYTSYDRVPYIDVPFNIVSTQLDLEEAIQFDNKDFFVRNNKYFLSLVKLVPKNRQINIVNKSTVPLVINEINFYNIKDRYGVENIQISNNTLTEFPFTLTKFNSLSLDLEFIGTDFGHYSSFIILSTDQGDVWLTIAAFVNTKYKDVYVLMENVKGTNFTAPLNGADIDYIKLINFGEDISLLETTKMGYDRDEFLVANVTKLFPETTNYIQNIFVPTSTGKKISQLDFNISDMLETYRLYESEEEYIFKIQNSHILAEMVGTALTEGALPQFSKSVVDFGFVRFSNRKRLNRVDTFKIRNLGLNSFLITNIKSRNPNSPFTVALPSSVYPIRVDKEITLPIYINNNRLNDTDTLYMDTIVFEMQDLKNKRIFNYEIIVKVELTEVSKEYFSFNSESIRFGYSEINHFKTDELQVKNYSTDKVNVAVTYTGDVEIQPPSNFSFNLWPNQTFTIPIYFYPHGIGSFQGNLKLDFGTYQKNIALVGAGVDFKSPLITTKNTLEAYYSKLKTYMNEKKYI